MWIKEALGAGRALVLIPSLGLLSQTLRMDFIESKESELICVCSDKSVAVRGGSDDAWIERVSELGYLLQASPTKLENLFSIMIWSCILNISVIAISRAVQIFKDIPPFDITFADEAHRCAGMARESIFSSVLDERKIRSKTIVYDRYPARYFRQSETNCSLKRY